jgi:thiamine kinase-like enzyme
MELASKTKAEQLTCWEEQVIATPLTGGITNTNFKVHYRGEDFVVRIGVDIPEHGIMRFNEFNASTAAYKAGISPEIIHQSQGALVMRFIDGTTLTPEMVQEDSYLERILSVLKRCHYEIPLHLKAGTLIFWAFQVIRNYAGTLKETHSPYESELPRLMQINNQLEKVTGRSNITFCHNDMLAANFINTPKQIWLIDWDYAGFNNPLFDLSNLATNNELSHKQEKWLLDNYFECNLNDKLWLSYCAMKCTSLLRESMWSMVSEQFSTLDFNYKKYTEENMERFEYAYLEFTELTNT